jgi:predicted ATPase
MKKFVLTGGPGTGKTSILLALELRGEQVVHEAARDYINYQRANNIKDPLAMHDFEEQVLKLHLMREERIPISGKRIFFDRGKPDHLAYNTLFNRNLPEYLLKAASNSDYTDVFLIEPINDNWKANPLIFNQRENPIEIHNTLISVYKNLGYNPIPVLAGTLVERVEFIINHIQTFEYD